MEIRTIDFYDEFKCIGSKCPYSCCMGWAIAIDDETYDNYKKEPGLKGKALLALTKNNRFGIRTVRMLAGRCPYHTHDCLCRHQKNGEQHLMPYACRHYPRRSVDFGEYAEVTLELSCIKVAEIFVKHMGRRSFISRAMQDDVNISNQADLDSPTIAERQLVPAELSTEKIMWKIGNYAPDFLSDLNKDRKDILDYIWNDSSSFEEKIRDIYEFAYIKNCILAKDKLEEAKAVTLPVDSICLLDYSIPTISEVESGYAFYPLWFVNQLIYQKLLREDFKSENSFMKGLVKDYEACFGGLTEREADSYYNEKLKALFEAYPDVRGLFVSYYSYLVMQSYCESYEDYYVLGPILLSMVQLQFLMEFFVGEFLRGNRIDDKLKAKIIANTEKTIRHNLHFNDYILGEIRKEFF